MCGVSGLYSNSVNDELKNRLARSLEFIGHRGPDSNGMYCSGNIVLGHTRLAIHDLTESGHQPMVSNNSSNALVFNGEIYNYQTLRRALPDLTFSGQSDTEVLLGYLDKYGVDKTLNDIDGMFAFAYWNKENQLLHLARDRMGEKPLYFKHTNDVFVFASELPALEQLTPEQNTIDPQAVNMFLRFGYIPAPLSIYHGIEKLEPGHRLTVSLKNKKIHLSKQRYYVANTKIDEQRTPQQTCDQLEQLLIKSVEQRLDADVPVGAFLSGGIDSSIIAAITKSALGRELDTFTIGFDEEKYDESGHAAEVAKHLGCNHHVKVVNERHMLELVPNLPRIYGEPFADSSQIPTLALCQQTKSAVTVAISGDGGDELFAGYSRYQHTINRWLTFQKYGSFIKNCAGGLSKKFDNTLLSMNLFISAKEKVRRALRYSGTTHFPNYYIDNISADWQTELLAKQLPIGAISEDNLLRQMMAMDRAQYLPDDILVKVDRASMAYSLEVRVPLLANDIVDFSLSVPNNLLVNEGVSKWPLRKVLYKYVPRNLIERPKKGFAVPIAEWLTGELKDWAEALISDGRLIDHLPMVNHEQYRLYWLQHQLKQYNWGTQLWNYLQLLSWVQQVKEKS